MKVAIITLLGSWGELWDCRSEVGEPSIVGSNATDNLFNFTP